jgi:tetratricopeptide (TPR) repeat protein
MKGHWTSHVLAEVLRDLYFSERSGSLSLIRDGETRVLIFDRGMLQFAHSSHEEMNLGPRLVKSGAIETGALSELPRLSSPTDLPQALINQGLIDKSRLDAPIRELVRESVEEVFSWPEGLYQFREGWLLKDVFDSNVLFTFETILKGVARLADFGPVRDVLLQIDKPLSINPSIFLPVEKLGLSANEGFVLSRVDGRTPIRDIVALVPQAMEEATCRFLYGVLVLGMVQFGAAAPGQRMFSLRDLVSTHREAEQKARQQRTLIRETYLAIRTQAPHAVLGLPDRAGVAEARGAYEAARQRFAPEGFLPEVQAELKEELQIIESRLVEAFLALQESQVHNLKEAAEKRGAAEAHGVDLESFALRREISKSEKRLGQDEREAKANDYYQMARRAFQKADYQNCLTYCQESLRHEPLAITHALLGDVLVRNPDRRWQRQAEESYQKAIDMDPWNPDHLVSLGRLYRSQGLHSRARKVIEKALEITPNHTEARAILAELHVGVDPEPQVRG